MPTTADDTASPASPQQQQAHTAYLEHFPESGSALKRVFLTRSPFRLGRDASADLVVYCPRVSKKHAHVILEGGDVFLVDVGSTNGTFVNGRRLHERVALVNGDIIHLAEKEFRFGRVDPGDAAQTEGELPGGNVTESAQLTGLRSLIQDSGWLRELIDHRQVDTLFQPLVRLADRRVVAYEALGSGKHPSLPADAPGLFKLAEKLKLTVQLSRAFRAAALAEAASLPLLLLRGLPLFLGMHPDELHDMALPGSLRGLPRPSPEAPKLVLEIHHNAIADTRGLARLRASLRDLDVGLAYDDLGVGQSRLAALAQVPADYVKLDAALVGALPHSPAMRELVRGLVGVCSGLGTQVVVEGLSTEEEAALCLELGCQLGQGELFT